METTKRPINWILLVSVVGALGLSMAGCFGGGEAYVVADTPPAPRAVVVEERPGYVWIDGRWAWGGGRWVWYDGYYVAERPGYVYAPGYWEPRGGRYYWVEGRWNSGGAVGAYRGGGGNGGVIVREHGSPGGATTVYRGTTTVRTAPAGGGVRVRAHEAPPAKVKVKVREHGR
jgi:hypothetical protein